MKKWSHNELANDLAEHLRGTRDRVVWTDMQLGPQGSPRPDVYTVPKSFAKFRPLAYEVKISTADYRRDVTAGKWQSYLQFASGVIFAVPAGLVKKEDIPAGCGLLVRYDDIWRTVKGPTLKVVDQLPLDTWIKLMIDGIERQAKDPEGRTMNEYRVRETIRKKYGDTIAHALSDLNNAEMYFRIETAKLQRSTEELREEERKRMQHIREDVEREIKHTSKATRDLATALGCKEDANIYTIAHAANEAAERLSSDGEIVRLRKKLKRAIEALNEGLEPLPTVITPPQQVDADAL